MLLIKLLTQATLLVLTVTVNYRILLMMIYITFLFIIYLLLNTLKYSKVFCFKYWASYINQGLIPPACKFLNFFILKIKLINFPNVHFSIFHLYLFHIIKSPFNILIFYFQTIHLLLPFSKACFKLVQIFY